MERMTRFLDTHHVYRSRRNLDHDMSRVKEYSSAQKESNTEDESGSKDNTHRRFAHHAVKAYNTKQLRATSSIYNIHIVAMVVVVGKHGVEHGHPRHTR